MVSQLRRKPNAFNLVHQMRILRKMNDLDVTEKVCNSVATKNTEVNTVLSNLPNTCRLADMGKRCEHCRNLYCGQKRSGCGQQLTEQHRRGNCGPLD